MSWASTTGLAPEPARTRRLPVIWLRDTAIRLGLLRKHRGELRVTKLGAALADDPVGLLATVASRVPIARYPSERDAAMIMLLITAGGGKQTSWQAKEAERTRAQLFARLALIS